MAIYRLFLEKDTSLYTEVPLSNVGRDEMLEIGSYKDSTNTPQLIRSLVKVSTEDIKRVVNTFLEGKEYSATLNMKVAEASEIPLDLEIETHTVAADWDNGTGKFGDIPVNLTGTSWYYRKLNQNLPWFESLETPGITGSFSDIPGGGAWYETGSLSTLIKDNSILDLSIDVTETVSKFYLDEIQNEGFVIKLSDSLENNPNSNIRIKYFSKESNTIYPATLDIKWDDSVYVTGSLPVLTEQSIVITAKNNKEFYKKNEIAILQLLARPQYPIRTFTTSSIYTQDYALPEQTYWAVVDNYTKEVVIDFDYNFTKVSCSEKTPFIRLFMDSLQPERYYKILFQTNLSNGIKVVDPNIIFKVER